MRKEIIKYKIVIEKTQESEIEIDIHNCFLQHRNPHTGKEEYFGQFMRDNYSHKMFSITIWGNCVDVKRTDTSSSGLSLSIKEFIEHGSNSSFQLISKSAFLRMYFDITNLLQ